VHLPGLLGMAPPNSSAIQSSSPACLPCSDPNANPEREANKTLFKMLTPPGTDALQEARRCASCRAKGEPYKAPLRPFLKALLGSDGIHTGSSSSWGSSGKRSSVGSEAARRAGAKHDFVVLRQLQWLLMSPRDVQDEGDRQALLAMLAQHNPAWANLGLDELKCLAECMERVHLFAPSGFHEVTSALVSAVLGVCGV
jgi:hypothetical protein